jgi:nucleotide-binding universal stress UspA family protein
MNKKILIPTDFSKNAWNAVTYAADLYKDTTCDFYLLHSFQNSVPSKKDLIDADAASLTFQREKTKSDDGLAKVMEMLGFRNENEKHIYTVISVQNYPYDAIKEIVAKRDIELVVMGTKGASNYKGTHFGSNTIHVMEHLRSCPVLGIPMEATIARVKEIVFPTSFKTHYKRKELFHLVELSQLHDATICVLHVSDNEELTKNQLESKQLLEECLEGATCSLHHISGSNVASGVKYFVESRNSDMIAFINRKHTLFSTLFSTPMVKELGMFSKVPLLVLHDTRD